MKTITQNAYGAPQQVLLTEEVPMPSPGEGEVLVRVRASSVNTPDWLAALGVPYVLRLATGVRAPSVKVRGSDVAGVVAAVGAQVTGFAPGDEVFGSTWTGELGGVQRGAFAEYVVVPADQLALKPKGLTFEEAAAAVMSGVTALQALRDVAQMRAGQRVLINGASGGVGLFAVQLAKALGAEVTGVCSTRNVELVRSVGADHVIDYTQTNYADGDARYDVVMDNVLNHAPSTSARVLAPGGVLLLNSIGDPAWLGSLPTMAYAALFKAKQWRTTQFKPSRENLEALRALLESGAVRVVIDSVYPLEAAGQAVAHMASRRARGKVVLTTAG